MRSWSGALPGPCWGSSQRFPDPLAGLEDGKERRGEEEKGGKGRTPN